MLNNVRFFSEKYGKICGLYAGRSPVVILSDFEAIKKVNYVTINGYYNAASASKSLIDAIKCLLLPLKKTTRRTLKLKVNKNFKKTCFFTMSILTQSGVQDGGGGQQTV